MFLDILLEFRIVVILVYRHALRRTSPRYNRINSPKAIRRKYSRTEKEIVLSVYMYHTINCTFIEKPIQGPSMVWYLPPEVMIEILVKCHVKTLLRFRVVCKLWCSLISSHQFIRRHLSRCAGDTQRIFLLRNDMLYDLRFYLVSDSMVLEETSIDIPRGSDSCFSFMACDGLIWVKEEFSGKTLLWNPSTRDSKMLPSISEAGVVHVKGRGKQWKYEFGYDCNSDDYKVLTLVPDKSVLGGDVFSYKSLMYTLRTNSWRWIQNSPPATWFKDTASTFVSGALHWRASVSTLIVANEFRMDQVIVSFDLTTETYMEVPLPQYVGVSYEIDALGASRRCLCLLARDLDDLRNDIWVLKEYGVPESWTKTVKIPKLQDTFSLTPMTWFVENGEILLNLHKILASYNPNKDSIRYFATDDVVGFGYLSCVGYEESLVSPSVYTNHVTCRLNIKIGQTMRKEEKDIDNKERQMEKKSECSSEEQDQN